MYLINVFDNDFIVDQHVVAMEEISELVNQASKNGFNAIVTKITKALSVNEEGLLVC
jgi:hypothetical protein